MAEQITIQVTENKTINVADVLGNLKISDAAPTVQGLYILSEVGTYANLGGLVAASGKLNYAYFDGTTWSLIATNMPQGADGVDGKTILSGTTNPTTEGVDGDFYINTSTQTIFGPKTAGSWGAGTILKEIPIDSFSKTATGSLQNKVITEALQKINKPIDSFEMPLTNVYFIPITIDKDGFKVAGAEVEVSFLNLSSGVTFQSSLYDSNFTLISAGVTTQPKGVGKHYFALPYVELAKGTYYISLSTNDFAGNVFKIKGEIKDCYSINQIFPSPTVTPTLLKKSKTCPKIKLIEHTEQDIAEPTFYNSNGWKYMCFISEALTYGVIIGQKDSGAGTNKIGYSSDRGLTFTDLGLHYGGNVNILDIFFDTNTKSLFAVSGSMNVTKSNNILDVINGTATLSWTSLVISDKNPTALYLTMGGCIANGFLWLGEYSNAGTGELATSPRIYKIDTTTLTATRSFSIPNSRHIHAIRPDSDGRMWVCAGDLNYGNGVGFWRLDTINPSGTADTWVKYSRSSYIISGTTYNVKNSNAYPVGFSFVTIDGIKHILGAADRPKMLTTVTPILTELTGIANINAQAYTKFDAKSGETQRGGILDYNQNFWTYSQETTEPKLWVSPPPYQQRYEVSRLYDGRDLQGTIKDSPIFYVKNKNDNDGYIFINNYRFSAVAVSQLKTTGVNYTGTIVDSILYDGLDSSYSISQVVPSTSVFKKIDFIDRINVDMQSTVTTSLYVGISFLNFVKTANHKTLKVLFRVNSVGAENPRVQLRMGTTQTTGGVSQVDFFGTGVHQQVLDVSSLTDGTYNTYVNLILKSDGIITNTTNIDILKIWVE